MNYIRHLNERMVTIYADDRLHPGHISLYMALFFYWNLHRFPSEFYANRIELMKMAKIGSKSTYHRVLKELDTWGYIHYCPSHSPKALSTVRLSQKHTDAVSLSEQTRTIFGNYCPIAVPHTLYNKHYKHCKRSLGAKPRSQLEVLDFFKEKKYDLNEAFKFFNHYQAIGWKIGGKITIEDWKAAADNWMLKANQLAKHSAAKKAVHGDNLMTQKEKDYGQPL
ncbi:MAG: hypothetical protein AAF554_18230 [Bacteroidota bacterium]